VTYSLVHANTVATLSSVQTGITPTCTSTTAANLLVVVIGTDWGNLTPAPPAGWQTGKINGTNGSNIIFYYPNCPAGITSVAVTWASAGGGTTTWVAQVLEFHDSAGTNTSPLDVTGVITNDPTTPTPIATSGTTAAANELAVAVGVGFYSSATKDTISAGTGFTQAGQLNNGTKAQDHIGFDYQLDTGSSAGITVTDSMTYTGPFTIFSGVIATFKVFTAAVRPAAPSRPNYPVMRAANY
jgi:hypothetical protein